MSTWLLGVTLAALLVTAIPAGHFAAKALWRSSWLKELRALRQEVADLRALYDNLLDSHKRLRSREGMRELRGRTKEPEPDDIDQARARGDLLRYNMRKNHLA